MAFLFRGTGQTDRRTDGVQHLMRPLGEGRITRGSAIADRQCIIVG